MEKETPTEEQPLTASQRARIERNRQKALLLRQARIASEPYPKSKPTTAAGPGGTKSTGRQTNKVVDTGGGFLLEEDDDEDANSEPVKIVHPAAPLIDPSELLCEDCGLAFIESHLNNHFDVDVCDKCKEENEHDMITKTEAKTKYLLKDVDFDTREPPLKFILRKNPRDQRWGNMKLYLESQVKARAIEVWGDMEMIEDEKEKRLEKREETKQKKYDKKIKDLRRQVRGSLWKKESTVHEHEYGTETYDEEEDIYRKKCLTCDHTLEYEKM
ncbi:DNA repair protein complementing XP-A cells homolog [Tubulanus polymorphus]|uniref:DNA repair protein complementing XP-A cells homolog n=1 Tax=Tubulanus polymorphus TaxID=672921 RepID=UPI003DA520C1